MKISAIPMLLAAAVAAPLFAQASPQPAKPRVARDLVIAEKNGLLAFEAEHFFAQEKSDIRAWYLVTKDNVPVLKPDGDQPVLGGVSGGAHLEILPDTRRNHGEKLINGENFSNTPGKLAILKYRVHFETPGRYRVWARVRSTTTEDNGLHFGLDDAWPESGQRWQTVVKQRWHWESKQRTAEKHSGVPGRLFLEIDKAGPRMLTISMREDGIEFDKIVLAKDFEYRPEGVGPEVQVKSGQLPKAFPFVKPAKPEGGAARPETPRSGSKPAGAGNAAGRQAPSLALHLPAKSFPVRSKGAYLDDGRFHAIDPEGGKTAKTEKGFPYPDGTYDIVLYSVGEDDGKSRYKVFVNDVEVGSHETAIASSTKEEGPKFRAVFRNTTIARGDVIRVETQTGSKDGLGRSRARWSGLTFRPADEPTRRTVAAIPAAQRGAAPAAGGGGEGAGKRAKAGPYVPKERVRKPALAESVERGKHGDGTLKIAGERKAWHRLTFDFAGPWVHENDRDPNPFTDYALVATITGPGGTTWKVPGYFAADGNAADTGAQGGHIWRAHFRAPKPGKYAVKAVLWNGRDVALGGKADPWGDPPYAETTFEVAKSDKTGRDFRAHGRLEHVGERYLRFAGSGKWFLKAGADAPETFLAYRDFDATEARNPKKGPLKTWQAHVRDWKPGDPSWKDGKGKGMIGALNYLAGKGANAFSFLPYNGGGDGDNVWPFNAYDERFHYDCSKLDQWGIVFDHATRLGLYLHFKLQETENDDHPMWGLDGGYLGPERKLYLREMIARFGDHLALNWNLGEENTQTTAQQKAMIDWIRTVDPYDNHVVIHTYPGDHEKVHRPLLGDGSQLTGLSMQNSSVWKVHPDTLKWVRASTKAGKPWVVAFDEPGDAKHGMPPDPDYGPGYPKGYDGPTIHDTRAYALWGNLMAGGAGVEYYFGYQLAQNDLVCEDWRSRDQSWDYCRLALEFFAEEKLPLTEMTPRPEIVKAASDAERAQGFCLVKEKGPVLVFLPQGGKATVDLARPDKPATLTWFDPRTGERRKGAANLVAADAPGITRLRIEAPDKRDWLVVLR